MGGEREAGQGAAQGTREPGVREPGAGGPGVEGPGVEGGEDLSVERLLAAEGRPPFERRLTDKILRAYTQAYAQGERALAAHLRSLLAEAEAAGRRHRPERRAGTAEHLADLWTAFCDARELYRHAARPLGRETAANPARVEATLEMMRVAYLRWRRAV